MMNATLQKLSSACRNVPVVRMSTSCLRTATVSRYSPQNSSSQSLPTLQTLPYQKKQRRCYQSTGNLQNKHQNDDAKNETGEDAKKQTPHEDQPHGTATVSFVEFDDDHPANYQDDAAPKHPIDSLKGGDPSAYTQPVVIRMPDMSEDDDIHNTVEKWYKQPGDVIKRNDVLCDITTPDFTFGMVTEDEEDSIMGEIHVEEGRSVPDHTPICTVYHLPEKEKQ